MKQYSQQSGQKSKEQYFLSKGSTPSNSNRKQNSANLYYMKNSVELSYLTDRMIDSQNISDLENSSSNRKKSNTLNLTKFNNIDGVITRNSHLNLQFPSPTNYVNLSYQKLKSLNANNLTKGFQDSVVSDKTMRQSHFQNSERQSQKSSNQKIFGNGKRDQEYNKNTTIHLDELNQQNNYEIRDSSIENNKFYNHNQNFSQSIQNVFKNQQDEYNQNNLLQLQLSPIIRRYNQDNRTINQAELNDQKYLLNNYIQSAQKSSQVQDNQMQRPLTEKVQDYKQIKKDLLKKVKLSTDHAFHYSSGRAKLKNKRQMFSPCQSARYECKVQFENKYLIKTSFIQPSDKNKDVQMVSVDLIQKRRVELIQKLENLQNMKQKIQLDKQEETQKQFQEESFNNKDKVLSQQQSSNVIQGIQEDDKEDSIAGLEKNQKDQNIFSEKITKLKMLDNFNIKMKGIQNQIKDINQIVSKEVKIPYQQSNDLNKSVNILDQSNRSVNNGNSFQNSFQNSKIKDVSINISNQSLNKNTSYFSKLNNQSVKSIRSYSKQNQFDLPFCNSNEILRKYNNLKKIQQQEQEENEKMQRNLQINNQNLKQTTSFFCQKQTSFEQQSQNQTNALKLSLSIDSKEKQDLQIAQQLLDQQGDQISTSDKKFLIMDHLNNQKKSPFFTIKNKIQSCQEQNSPRHKEQNQQILIDLNSQRSIQDQNIGNQNNLLSPPSQIAHSKQLIDESQDANKLLSQNDINQKPQSQKQSDKEFLSALLTSWKDKKKETKKPISSGFGKRRFIFQKNAIIPKKKVNKKKIRESLLIFLHKLKQSKLQLEEFCEKRTEIFMEKPLQRLGSFVFFKAVKHNNLVSVKNIIGQCRYFIFDFDQKKQTCLHKAAKKGYTNMLEYFINLGADLEFKDIAGRKALYYAIKNNNLPCIKLLLKNMANPWSYENADYNKLIKDKPEAQKLLKIFKKLHLLLIFTPYKDKQELIKHTIRQQLQEDVQ